MRLVIDDSDVGGRIIMLATFFVVLVIFLVYYLGHHIHHVTLVILYTLSSSSILKFIKTSPKAILVLIYLKFNGSKRAQKILIFCH